MPRGPSGWSRPWRSCGDRGKRARLRAVADLSRCAGRRCLHAAASCVLGPGIAAISLGLVGHAAIGERLGRNARFASIGNGLAAAAMGACGYFFSPRAVFFVTAALLIPALLALRHIGRGEIDPGTRMAARRRADIPSNAGRRSARSCASARC